MKKIFLVLFLSIIGINYVNAQNRTLEEGMILGYEDAKRQAEGTGYWSSGPTGVRVVTISAPNGTTYTYVDNSIGDVWSFYSGAQNTVHDFIYNHYIPGCQTAIQNNLEPEYNQGKISGALAYWAILNGGGMFGE